MLNKWAYIWTALVQTLLFKTCDHLTTEPNLKSPETFRVSWGSIWPKQLSWPLASEVPRAASVSAQGLSYLSGTITCLWFWWSTGTVAITRHFLLDTGAQVIVMPGNNSKFLQGNPLPPARHSREIWKGNVHSADGFIGTIFLKQLPVVTTLLALFSYYRRECPCSVAHLA